MLVAALHQFTLAQGRAVSQPHTPALQHSQHWPSWSQEGLDRELALPFSLPCFMPLFPIPGATLVLTASSCTT